ncbi:MAG TPA: DUF2497 domain-containing protein [Stellaceae bacterium]|nr:DUF2497 domain-containing protein [Stellaceae bacterium]
MSEAKGQQHEPSMEEILASIRRIIAEDGDGAAPAAAPEEKPAGGRGEEILELTDVVDESGAVVSLNAPAAKPAPEPPPPPKREPPPALEMAPPPPPPPPDPVAPPTSDEARLVSGATAAASVAALSQLQSLGHRDPGDDIPLGNVAQTLESLVRDMLRPLLKDWLDTNLAQLVERLVHEEIQRMVRDVQRR